MIDLIDVDIEVATDNDVTLTEHCRNCRKKARSVNAVLELGQCSQNILSLLLFHAV